MNVSDYRNLSFFQGLDLDSMPETHEEPLPISQNVLDKVFNEIFAVDDVSKLPKGDLAYYLSPDSNPDIRLWLENNLLKPRAARSGSSIAGVTDDLIVEMSKSRDESFEDYAYRLSSIRDSAMAEYERSLQDLNNSVSNG